MADRNSMRPPAPRRRSQRHSDPNIFSDEYALDPIGISNTATSNIPEATEPSRRRHQTRTPSATERLPHSPLDSQRRSNIPYPDEGQTPGSSALRYSQSTGSRTSYDSSGTIHRELSNASASFIPRAQSPYRGPTGPSHPYATYSQDQEKGIGRAPSGAALNTRMPLQNYSGPSGPSHPYGMYAQNTVSEEDSVPNNVPTQNVPIADAEPTQSYQRRQGPDGEEADDLIGPDGHTEQLPPYTKYPNDLPTKENIAIPQPDLNTLERSLEDSQETANHSPTGSAERRSIVSHDTNIEISSEQANQTHSSSESRESTHVSSPQTSTNPLADEGGNFKEAVVSKGKRPICGLVPLWLLILVVAVIAVVVIVGGTVGGVLRHKQSERDAAAMRDPQSPAATVTVTSIIDAEPVTATPSNFPPLPTGPFVVPMKNPSIASSACLSEGHHSGAWACTNGPSVRLKIVPRGTGLPLVHVESGLMPNVYRYGAQPPELTYPADVMVMNDMDDRSKGPAYFFQELYTKLVVLRPEEFEGLSKRWLKQESEVSEQPEIMKRGLGGKIFNAVPNDRPWFCFWNDTILEGFIYPNHDSDNTIKTSAPLAAMSAPNGASGTGLRPTDIPPSFAASASNPSPTAAEQWKNAASFPKLVKFEERRAPNSPPPICRQMQILYNGQAAPLPGVDEIELEEVEPMQQSRLFSYYTNPNHQQGGSLTQDSSESRVKARSLVACKCEWQND